MTNLEAIKAILKGRVEVAENDLADKLSLKGIDPASTYDPANPCALYGLSIGLLKSNNDNQVSSFSEGGYSVSFDRSQLPGIMSAIANESGCPDLIKTYTDQPTIENLSIW